MWRAALERSEEKSLSWYGFVMWVTGNFTSECVWMIQQLLTRANLYPDVTDGFIICFISHSLFAFTKASDSHQMNGGRFFIRRSPVPQAFYSSTSLKSSCRCLISDQHILIKLDSFNEAGLKHTPFCNVLACTEYSEVYTAY